MLSNLKIDIRYFLGLLLIAVGLCVIIGINARNIKEQQNIIAEKNSKIEYYKNDLGTETAKRVAVEASKKKLKESYDEEIKELKRRHSIKLSSLESAILASTATVVTDTVEVHYTDTVLVNEELPTFTFSKTDVYHSISGSFYNGRINYEFSAFDSLSFVFHYNRTGFLGMGPRELVVEGSSSNPYTKIDGIKGIKVGVERRRPFGIGITAGYGITDSGIGPFIGVGLTYNIVRF